MPEIVRTVDRLHDLSGLPRPTHLSFHANPLSWHFQRYVSRHINLMLIALAFAALDWILNAILDPSRQPTTLILAGSATCCLVSDLASHYGLQTLRYLRAPEVLANASDNHNLAGLIERIKASRSLTRLFMCEYLRLNYTSGSVLPLYLASSLVDPNPGKITLLWRSLAEHIDRIEMSNRQVHILLRQQNTQPYAGRKDRSLLSLVAKLPQKVARDNLLRTFGIATAMRLIGRKVSTSEDAVLWNARPGHGQFAYLEMPDPSGKTLWTRLDDDTRDIPHALKQISRHNRALREANSDGQT